MKFFKMSSTFFRDMFLWILLICGISGLEFLIFFSTHNIYSFHISLATGVCFFAFFLGYFFQSLYQNQTKFGQMSFGIVYLVLNILFFFFLKSHLQDYILEDTGFYFIWPLIGIFLCILTLIGIVPSLAGKNQNALYQRNRNHFVSAGVGFFYGTLITIAILLILFSVDSFFWSNFFNQGFNSQIYIGISSASFILISSYFFLKNRKTNIGNMENIKFYSYETQAFTKLFFPFLIIIGLVLFAYLFKIFISKTWINYSIGSWILIFDILWIILYCIMFYERNKPKDNIIFKIFWLIIIGLSVLLLLSVNVRVFYNGRSVLRYASYMIGLMSILIGLTQLAYKNLHTIGIILLTTLVWGFFGPLNGLKVSNLNQYSRLENILTSEGILKSGVLVTPEQKLSNEKQADILLRLQNYVYNFGTKNISPWYQEGSNLYMGDAVSEFMDITGIKRGFEKYQAEGEEAQVSTNTNTIYDVYRNYSFSSQQYWYVQGYEEVFSFLGSNDLKEAKKYGQNAIRLVGNNVRIFYEGQTYNIDLNGYIKSISKLTNTSDANPNYNVTIGNISFRFVFSNLQINTQENIITNIETMIFVKKI